MSTIKNGFVDLTHSLHSSIPSWDGSCGFTLDTDVDYKDCAPPYLFRTNKIHSRAGMGTHMDAPAHCFAGANTIDMLPLEDFIVPCVVIKPDGPISDRYVLDCKSVQRFEEEHGMIQRNSFVIVCTGWARYWNEPEKYRNELQFPSVHEDVAALLIERGILGLGTDTLSADAGGKAFPVHRTILGSGKYLVENIANSDILPPTGSTALVMPMKIFEGTEAPIRLAAVVGGITNQRT